MPSWRDLSGYIDVHGLAIESRASADSLSDWISCLEGISRSARAAWSWTQWRLACGTTTATVLPTNQPAACD